MKTIRTAMLLFCFACASPGTDQAKISSATLTLPDGKTKIEMLKGGEGDTCLLFLHGWNISKEYWMDQLEYFGDNYRVYAIDLPGYGGSTSTRNSWTIEQYGKDISGVIMAENLSNVVLIGHSMSGVIALEAALDASSAVIGLVGIDNFKMVGAENPPGWDAEVAAFVEQLEANYSSVVEGYAVNYLFHAKTDSAVKERVLEDYVNANEEVALASFASILAYSKNETNQLKKLPLKLLLLQSDGMPTYTSWLDTNLQQGYRVEEISEVGHFPMIEKPAEFNRKLESLLALI